MKRAFKKFCKACGVFLLGLLAIAGCWAAPALLVLVLLIAIPLFIGIVIGEKD